MLPLLLACSLLAADLPAQSSYLEGVEAMEKGRHGSAAHVFRGIAANDGPLAQYAAVREAMAIAEGGDSSAAAKRLREIIDSSDADAPWKPMAQHQLALLLNRLGKPGQAGNVLAEAADRPHRPRWLSDYDWNAASYLLRSPLTALRGYSLYAQLLEHAPYRSQRVEAAEALAESPLAAHRLMAAETLLDAGRDTEAKETLAGARVILGEERPASYHLLQGRLLLAQGQNAEGRSLLRVVYDANPSSPVGWEAEAHRLFSILRSGKAGEDAQSELEAFLEKHGRTDPAAELLLELASVRAADGEIAQALGYYRRAASLAPPEHAVRALDSAAEMMLEREGPEEALPWFAQIASRFPDSRRAPEAWRRVGEAHLAAGESQQAQDAFRQAAALKLGDFYVHRSLERLHGLGETETAGRNLQVMGAASFVRPRAVAADPDARVGPGDLEPGRAFAGEVWHQRLSFFGAHGLEEGEWEALAVLTPTEGQQPDARRFHAVAEAGFAGTAMELAHDWNIGEDPQGMSKTRLLVEFPLVYWNEARRLAAEAGVDPLLLLAIARQESRFRARAVSRAGATGVMQLMPSTAAWMAEVDPNVGSEHAARLTNPENSLRMGAFYMRRMLRQFDGNLVLALGAYNGGPGNMRKWLRARPVNRPEDLDAFVDAIPFGETRGYIRKVLGNYAAYHSLYPDHGTIRR